MPTPSPPTATPTRPPGWFESFRKRSAHETSGHLGGLLFALGQVAFRTVALLFETATLAFVAWTFAKWQDEATVRVDIVWPCFFPIIVAILADGYELVSLLFLARKRPINSIAVAFDIVVAGVGIFCFITVSLSGYEAYRGLQGQAMRPRARWATDMNTLMVFMLVFSLLHILFVVVAAIGGVYLIIVHKRVQRLERVARNQAEMIQFSERRKRMTVAAVPV
ncbi:hypothetical protein B0T18DRAFT_319752 [Schizothecium vesticola]|uniref:MARVEL domain-containing protein n=1 Tax=Schizothecium vesticola TaxID=314040 RepID=A0AA40KAR1_9PEZI|nr:hypothetical protein B0T18DRAFT_319752 [Schizothecium vesticola]